VDTGWPHFHMLFDKKPKKTHCISDNYFVNYITYLPKF
jgi:hypothetical protein